MRRPLCVLLCLLGLCASPVWAQDIGSNLIAHYNMNAGTGTTVIDNSGTGNTLFFNGTPLWTSGNTGLGGAIDLNSTDDNVQTGAATALPLGATAPFTIACWFKAAATTNLSEIFSFGYDPPLTSQTGGLRGFLVFNARYYFHGDGADWDTGVTFNADSTWHHIVFTASATQIRFYRDGTLAAGPATRPAALVTGTFTFITVGKNHPAGSAFLGQVDEARIYARELTAADITALAAYRDTAAAVVRRSPIVY